MPNGDGKGPRKGSAQQPKTGSKGKKQIGGKKCPKK